MTAFAFDNSYARLEGPFFARVAPSAAVEPHLIALNRPLAEDLGLDPAILSTPEGVDMLAGKHVPDGAEPIATAYAGHQFGNFVPQLGDGRAILLGEVVDRAGRRRDIQLKGSGPTPFSRRGDGRAALGPVLREYLISEAMMALGIPTTRALAALLTGDMVARETMLPGAMLVRVASSHIRVGTFQYFAARRDHTSLKTLADHAIARHYPELAGNAQPYRALLEGVANRQARLVAQWMTVGFIHGVMNTDNSSIAGETIDYGPCAFLDAYHPSKVFSSIDEAGRYAFANQPGIARWNLARLAECLVPLMGDDQDAAVAEAEAIVGGFADTFFAAYEGGLRRKLGLNEKRDGDRALADDLLERMARNEADFTATFRRLSDAAADPAHDGPVRDLFIDPTSFDDWAVRWRDRLADEGGDAAARRAAMRRANPAVIPRNHSVEAVIAAAVEQGDFAPFERLGRILSRPFDDHPDAPDVTDPPPADQQVYRTFCGT